MRLFVGHSLFGSQTWNIDCKLEVQLDKWPEILCHCSATFVLHLVSLGFLQYLGLAITRVILYQASYLLISHFPWVDWSKSSSIGHDETIISLASDFSPFILPFMVFIQNIREKEDLKTRKMGLLFVQDG